MTDEFYACSVCGEFEVGTHTEYKVIGIEGWLTEKSLHELEEELQAKMVSVNTKVVCNRCGSKDSQATVINMGDE